MRKSIRVVSGRIGRIGVLAAAAALLIVTAGCHRGAKPSGAQISELRYPINMEPDTLDPQVTTSLSTNELLQNVYEGLVTLNEKTQAAPAIAERWEISPDGRTYTFHLNPKAAFHNGRPVTADDVKYSYNRWCWPETKSTSVDPLMTFVIGGKEVLAGKRKDVEGVKVIDPHTVSITLDKPRAYFLIDACPIAIVCKEAVERSKGRFGIESAVGTGPFVLKEYQPGRRVVLEANRAHYRGRPPIDRIVRPIVVDSHTAHVKYENGEVDCCLAPITEFASDTQSPATKNECLAVATGNVNFVGMNLKLVPVFRNPKVRVAFAKAIDRDAISRIAYMGISPRVDSMLPGGVLGGDSNLRRLEYDPAAAKKLLAEAGYPDGKGFPKLTLIYIQGLPVFASGAQLVRDDLKKNLGITVDLQEREQAAAIADMNGDRLTFFLMGWTAIDPFDFLTTLLRSDSKQNHIGYSNPKFDSLCDKGDAEVDPDKRAAYYRQADEVATSEATMIPLTSSRQLWLVKPYVKDFLTNLGGPLPHYRTRIQH